MKLKIILKKDEDRKMDEFEKVEKLRQKANVSYEEAKKALDEANGDVLDAMLALEAQGKVSPDEQSTHSTTYDEQKDYVSVRDTVDGQDEKDKRTLGQKIKYLCKLIWLKCRNNKFTVERREERIISIPVWVLLLAIIFAFWTVGVIMIVGLFFDCRYAIVGPDDLSAINNVMDKAGDVVDKVKEEVNNL